MLNFITPILVVLLCISPFTFVFCLLGAIREVVQDGNNDIALGAAAAVSLAVLAAGCIFL